MAKTIADSFAVFSRSLEITSLQQATVSTRQTSVRTAVGNRLKTLDSFLTGSYRRHTMISPLKRGDVDVFVVLDSRHFTATGHATLLNQVRAALLVTYPKTPRISRNGQAVTITFTDFVVDVVPGFNRRGGGYLIPNPSEQRWIPTDPKAHVDFMSRANAAHGGELIPLIKMIKAWNRQTGSNIRSFYLELLIEQVLRGVTISNPWSGCRYVFDKGQVAVRPKFPDPSGMDPNQVPGLSGTTVAAAVAKFATAYRRARKAEQLAALGLISQAVDEWRGIFGNAFPAYG